MPSQIRLRALLAALAALALPSIAEARTQPPAFMPTGDVADAPSGFMDLCHRDQRLCAGGLAWSLGDELALAAAPLSPASSLPVVETGFGTAALSRGRHIAPETASLRGPGESEAALIRRIDRQTNRAVVQVSDLALTGQEEVWRRPDPLRPAGDCEDIAIEKRMRLLAAGFPPSRLFFAVAYLGVAGLHTVLVARMPDGDYVLDSRHSRVLRWSKSRYIWLRVQSTDDPLVWTRFGERSRPAERIVIAPPTPAPVVRMS